MVVDIATLIGVAVGIVALLTAYSKVQALVSLADRRDLELRKDLELLKIQIDDYDDRLTLTSNGLKERIEHCNLRLSNQFKECDRSIKAIEGYLQKNTSYERRSD